MGLDIDRMGTEKDISWSYTTLHIVRYVAVKLSGYDEDWTKFHLKGEKNDIWNDYPEFWQLLHFCDAEGVFVSGYFLKGVNFKDSFYLGDFDKLKEEMELLNTKLNSNQGRLKDIPPDFIEYTKKFIDFVLDEDGYDIMLFH